METIWSAHDSLDSWKRVLQFNSELTLNRIWFWLPGDSLQKMVVSLLEKDPTFETAVAIGSFNNAGYLELMAEAASK